MKCRYLYLSAPITSIYIVEFHRKYKVDYKFKTTQYKISVKNPQSVNRGISQILLDGIPLTGSSLPLVDDGQLHEVWVVMG